MNREETLKHLLELDKQFCDDAQENKALAWEKHYAHDGIIVTGGHKPYLIGKENVTNAVKGLYQLEQLQFSWEPRIADVSKDLTLGYTSGIYTRTYVYDGHKYLEKGKYTTIWKKVGDEWKIALDTGNEEQERID